MCFGTFDGLHPGHVSYFNQAKKHGDYLIVVVARDKSVLKLKKHPPKFIENERLDFVKKEKCVDEAVLGDEINFYKIIKEKKPDAICLGYDQAADEAEIKNLFPAMRIVRLKSYQPKKYKSSIINLKS